MRVVLGATVMALIAGGCVARVSVSSTGTEGNQASERILGVTNDGRYVLFVSDANNLVTGDSNGVKDVFRRDTTTNTTIRVGVAPNGSQLAAGANDGTMTPDGRYIAFVTAATLDPGDTNGDRDIYVRDLIAGTTTWASQPPPGGFPPGAVQYVAGWFGDGLTISPDGRYVSFLFQYPLFPPPTKLYRRDMVAGTTTLLNGENEFLGAMQASSDARHFALTTRCFTGLCAALQVRLIDTDNSANGWPALPFVNCEDNSAVINSTGRYLVWRSAGEHPAPCLPDGLYLVDRTTGTATNLGPIAGQASAIIGVNRDATSVVFLANGDLLPNGSEFQTDLYVHDMVRGTNARLNLTPAGQQANKGAIDAQLSDNGSRVAFTSNADDLVTGDISGWTDVFVRPIGVSAPAP